MNRYLDAPEASAPAPQIRHRSHARRWPLLLLALPAFVATWSGWVGLGRMVGFGVVEPLPGILNGFTIDTAITLPIGVEAYGAYALSAWITVRRLSSGTRRFAKWSALGSLLLGMLGQVAYHLLAVGGFTVAPWWVITIVSCLPVLVLGMGAGLFHMLARDAELPDAAADLPVAETVATPVAHVEEVATAAESKGDPESAEPAAPEPAPVEALPIPAMPLKLILLSAPPDSTPRPAEDSARDLEDSGVVRLETLDWSGRRGRGWSRPESPTWPQPVATEDQSRDRRMPTKQDRRDAVTHWTKQAKLGRVLTKPELAEWAGWSPTWALSCIHEARDAMAKQGWTFDSSGRPNRPKAGRVLVANGSRGEAS